MRSTFLKFNMHSVGRMIVLVILFNSCNSRIEVPSLKIEIPDPLPVPVVQQNKWGYINKAGEIIINPQFDGAGEFSEGVAGITISGKMGYIDKTGKIIINPQFESAGEFIDGLARISIDK